MGDEPSADRDGRLEDEIIGDRLVEEEAEEVADDRGDGQRQDRRR